jgi:putative transposase
MDEARFGRIDNASACWVPPKGRAIVGSQIIRDYTYAYAAVCPETGEHFSLILPYVGNECMDLCLRELSVHYKNYRMILAMDGASWHGEDLVRAHENIVPLVQPPYSPELNPVESLWHYFRETGGMHNTTFNSLEEVEEKLAELLKNLDENTVKSITLFNWIKNAI